MFCLFALLLPFFKLEHARSEASNKICTLPFIKSNSIELEQSLESKHQKRNKFKTKTTSKLTQKKSRENVKHLILKLNVFREFVPT